MAPRTRQKSRLGLLRILFRTRLSKAQLHKLLLIWPSILVLLGLIAYPLGTILLQSLFPKLMEQGFAIISLQSFTTIFSDDYTYKSILDALLFGGATAVISSILGTFLAIQVYRNQVHGVKLITLLIWLVFFTPSYLIAEGWVLMMQRKGILSEILGIPLGGFDWFFTPAGLILAMSFRIFPVIFFSVLTGLRGLGPDYEEAARTVGARSLSIWLKINIPLLFPSILAGATITFAESVSDFGFASAFVPNSHIPLLTYSIYKALSLSPVDFSQVGSLSIVLITIITLAMWVQKWILGKGSYSTVKNQIRPYRSTRKKTIAASLAAYVLLIIALAMPLSGILISSFMKNSARGFHLANLTLHNYAEALKVGSASYQALLRSLLLGLGTAIVASLLAIGLAFVIQRGQGFSTKVLYVLTMSTLAIPGIVLAAGYVFSWNAPYLVPFHLNLYGTMFCVFLAYIAGSLPNAIRLQIAAITQISPSLLSAGQVSGAGLFTLFRKILFPLVSGTVSATLYLIFSHLIFELPVSELLYPPGRPVFPVQIIHFYNDLQVEKGAALTILGVVLVLLIYGAGQQLARVYKNVKRSYSDRMMRELLNKRINRGHATDSLPGSAAIHLDVERQVL